jgi:hypothetical protein
LGTSRKKDKFYDAKMAFLVYYDDEIDLEEKTRRFDTLRLDVANNVVQAVHTLEWIPGPQSWHLDDENLFTDEEWDSTVEDFPKAQEVIQKVPEWDLQRRKLAAPEYWAQQKEAWCQNYEKELMTFRKDTETLGGDARMP